jgi:excisionase family DNA binding protein
VTQQAPANTSEPGAQPPSKPPGTPQTTRLPIWKEARLSAVILDQYRNILTVAQVCKDLGISRRTFYEWRAKKKAPKCINLPNGSLRIRRAEYQRWLESREDAA